MQSAPFGWNPKGQSIQLNEPIVLTQTDELLHCPFPSPHSLMSDFKLVVEKSKGEEYWSREGLKKRKRRYLSTKDPDFEIQNCKRTYILLEYSNMWSRQCS